MSDLIIEKKLMRKLGIIGGLSCESSAEYYLRITRKLKQFNSGHNAAEIMMISVSTAAVIEAINKNDWHQASEILIDASKKLEKMGVDCIIIPCNTLHKVAEEVQQAISIPLINIMDSVGTYIQNKAYSRVALLGTKFTMEDPFYRNYLNDNFNIEVKIPSIRHRELLHDIIFNELCHGIMRLSTKECLMNICYTLHFKFHCQAIILGCSEIPLLINTNDMDLDLIDTMEIHSNDTVTFLRNLTTDIKRVA